MPKPTIDDIRRQVVTHYGHAGLVMAQAMLGLDRNALAEALAEVTGELGAARRSGAEQRAAEVFGLMKLAGKIAVSLGLLPPEIDVDGTTKWAFDTFMDSGGAALDPAGMAIEALELAIASEWNVTIIGKRIMEPMRPAIGWYDDFAVYIPKDRLSRLAGSELAGPTIAGS